MKCISGDGKEERRADARRAALYRGRHLKGRNMESASGELAFALQKVTFYTPNTPPVLGPHPNVSAPRPRTKQCVYTKKLTLLI